MSGRQAIVFGMILLSAAGCASRWSLRTEQSETALQWPYAPNKAKLSYAMALKGFSHEKTSQSLLTAIVYGTENGGNDMFGLPFAVATGHDGRIAVADTVRRCVHLYIPAKQSYIRLSNKGELVSPVGLAFDDDLRLYVSDSTVGKVFIFGTDGALISSFQGSGAVKLKRPTGLAYSSHKKVLYVVDTLENRIYAFNAMNEIVFSFGGRGEEEGKFNYPTHIFWSPEGVLYVTDAMNFRVEKFDESGGFLGSFGQHGDEPGEIAMPKGVAADKDGTIYVADALFDSVQLFNRDGKFLMSVGKTGNEPGDFWLPSGIFIDESGKLYVCDTYNKRIQVFRITDNYDFKK